MRLLRRRPNESRITQLRQRVKADSPPQELLPELLLGMAAVTAEVRPEAGAATVKAGARGMRKHLLSAMSVRNRRRNTQTASFARGRSLQLPPRLEQQEVSHKGAPEQ